MLNSRMHHPAMAAGYAVRFDPATAAIAVATSIVGAIDDARQGAADRKAADFQARLLEQEAERETEQSGENAAQLRGRGSQIKARQRAVLAGSGLASGRDTAVDPCRYRGGYRTAGNPGAFRCR